MVRRFDVTGQGGIRLAAWELTEPPQAGEPSAGLSVLMLHGLLGHAAHWAGPARRLTTRARVLALDQRGHGHSEKPADGPFDRDAFVADAEAAVEQLGLAPVVLIGHAMGALTAWQLAARRPDLVRAVVICDMRAAALGTRSRAEWRQWLASWPLPFASRERARRWFAEEDPALPAPRPVRGDFFAAVMTETDDGWRPAFSRRQMLAAREGWVRDAHWDELALVRCPALVVRGLDGELGRAEAQEMVRVLPRGRYADIPDAGHLAHLERPDAWREIVDSFLADVFVP
jgi:pimeloyl-ACP methyl ester carboxylesterase